MTFKDSQSFLDSVLETMARKNADYCGAHQAADPLANLRLSEKVGLCDTKTAILSRLLDKVQRLVNLTTGHEPQVAETAEDTLQDLVGYALLLRTALLEESA